MGPPHRDLQDMVQLTQGQTARHHNPPPNDWFDVSQLDMEGIGKASASRWHESLLYRYSERSSSSISPRETPTNSTPILWIASPATFSSLSSAMASSSVRRSGSGNSSMSGSSNCSSDTFRISNRAFHSSSRP